ncbi:MAG: phasin family protein [Methyloceanibacter sp.]|uniref:phasin family protein n=1 Tax=Methyloceanibacter sp. TaxID=1965321 RepID=UPI003D9B8F9F
MTKRPMPREKRKDSQQQKKIVAAEITEATVHSKVSSPPQTAPEAKVPVRPKSPQPKPLTAKPVTAKAAPGKPLATKPVMATSAPAKPLAARPSAAKPSAAMPATAKPVVAKLTVPKTPPAPAPQDPAPERVAETPAARTLAAKTPVAETVAARALVSAAAPDEAAAPAPLESTVEGFQHPLQAASKGAVQVNRKLLDIAQENVNSSLELARDMVGATTPFEVMRLQMSWLTACVEALENHARDLRELSADLVTNTSKPLREHLRK